MSRTIQIFLSLTLAFVSVTVSASEFYFPGDDDHWETVNPETAGWDSDLLSEALAVAGERQSSGVVMLYNGRILAERYWPTPDNSSRYSNIVTGSDSQGRAIEDVASAQKNVTSLLAGMAQHRGFISLDDSISEHLGAGWSRASQSQEQAITFRHLLSMNSGLKTDLSFAAEPASTWLYNTPAYHVVMRAIAAATGIDRHQMTRQWITEPLGMEHSSWTPRPWASSDIAVGFSTTARELARFGLMIQAGGKWHNQLIFGDEDYIEEMMSPSQSLNPSYGFLWWLNGQEFSLGTGPIAPKRNGQLIPSAPADLVAMQGALDRKLYLVPSLGLIVTRLGSTGQLNDISFNDAFWEALMKAKL